MESKTMEKTSPVIENSEFACDVKKGLSASRKHLNSKYFYDKRGDEIFQRIMKLEEYYLTNSELEILSSYKAEILQLISTEEDFNLIDLGAGDAYKTKILLHYFSKQSVDFIYVPVDISPNAIIKVTQDLIEEIPKIKINGISKEYLKALNSLPDTKKKVILFLGASIGNFNQQETLQFLLNISHKLNEEDLLMIGFDLKKDPEVILNAYNDQSGVTKEFNLNLLARINRELGANFDLNSFDHSPHYDIKNGEAKSALISRKEQLVEIPSLEIDIFLKEGEPIHTEISRKFSLKDIEQMATASGFEVIRNFLDSNNYFTDSVWRKIR